MHSHFSSVLTHRAQHSAHNSQWEPCYLCHWLAGWLQQDHHVLLDQLSASPLQQVSGIPPTSDDINPTLPASMFFKSCNCNSSIATRVGFAVCNLCLMSRGRYLMSLLQFIFLLNSLFAWVMKTNLAIELIKKWSYDYIKMDCEGGKCYGVLAVRKTLLLFSFTRVLRVSSRCTESASRCPYSMPF